MPLLLWVPRQEAKPRPGPPRPPGKHLRKVRTSGRGNTTEFCRVARLLAARGSALRGQGRRPQTCFFPSSSHTRARRHGEFQGTRRGAECLPRHFPAKFLATRRGDRAQSQARVPRSEARAPAPERGTRWAGWGAADVQAEAGPALPAPRRAKWASRRGRQCTLVSVSTRLDLESSRLTLSHHAGDVPAPPTQPSLTLRAPAPASGSRHDAARGH